MPRSALGWAVFLAAATGGIVPAMADEPLHGRIDRAIQAKLEAEPAAIATDAEFLRRVYLDLNGMVPTPDEARAFLDDPSPYKRARLIDALLERPEFARRMQIVFDVMLMERRPASHVPDADWRRFLYESFRRDKPYDVLVREVLAADGTDPESRPAARFLLDREAEPNLITRDIGRMFLGRDMQCAQCHDHPLVDDYKQAHYYGLLAFVSRTSLFTPPGKGTVLAEKGDGVVEFKSVFKKKVTHQTGPRLLDAEPIVEPVVEKGHEYLIPPADTVRSVPAHSRRALLAPALTSGKVPEFDRNIANRLWALMFGRGLVHPLDMHHGENPPSHPELLDLLARDFHDRNYDVRGFLREIALSQTYQRSSEPPPGASETLLEPARYAVAPLKPLGPEQLGWSVLQALGLREAYRKEALARVDVVDTKLRDLLALDARRRALRDDLIENEVFDRLNPSIQPFITRFGGTAGQPQDAGDPTVHQALFLANGDPVQGWLAPSGANLTARAGALNDPKAIAEELYLAVLSRRPTQDERAEVASYLASRGDQKGPALQELVWSLLASTEFRFNH